MTTATITSKHQITIPASVRNELHLAAGDRIEFVKVADGKYEVVAATFDASLLKGRIKAKASVSIDQMNTAIKAKASSQ
jgi:AbrB family looped-hinge helix DNA binding protein